MDGVETPESSVSEAVSQSDGVQPTPESASAGNAAKDTRASMLATFKDMASPKDNDSEGTADPVDEASDPDTDGKPEKKGQTTEGKGDTPSADPAKLAKARETLKRNQWSDDDLANLPPERLLEKAKVLEKREKDQAQHHNELVRVKQALAELERERTDAIRAPVAETAANGQGRGMEAPALDGDVHQAIRNILAPLQEPDVADLYGDLVNPLTNGLTELASQMEAKRFADIERLQHERRSEQEAGQRQYQAVVAQMDRVNLRMAADAPDIRDQYPELRNPETFSKVVNKAFSLSNLQNQGYHDESGEPIYSELIKDAAALVVGPKDTVKQAQARLAKRQREVADSQPTPDSGSANRPRSMSFRDTLIHAAKGLDKGKGLESVRRELSSVG